MKTKALILVVGLAYNTALVLVLFWLWMRFLAPTALNPPPPLSIHLGRLEVTLDSIDSGHGGASIRFEDANGIQYPHEVRGDTVLVYFGSDTILKWPGSVKWRLVPKGQ